MTEEQALANQTLGDRMKEYEKEFEQYVDNTKWLVVRLDMRAGHTFCKKLQKPFDDRYTEAMISTTIELVRSFNAYTGYTQSDEITLVFPPSEEMLFSGRAQKIATILASTASVRFATAFEQWCRALPELDDGKRCMALDRIAAFDARVMSLPTKEEVFNNIMWRARDCVRNSIATCAQTHFSTWFIHGKNGDEMRKMLKETDGVPSWESMRGANKYGTTVKKTLIPIKGVNPQTGKTEETMRAHYATFEKRLTSFSQENVDFICGKTSDNVV